MKNNKKSKISKNVKNCKKNKNYIKDFIIYNENKYVTINFFNFMYIFIVFHIISKNIIL